MKVLVVEDNPRLRKSIVDYLRDEGCVTDAAGDGAEGLYKAVNWDYDVVVLDVMLPEMDGWSVLENIRQQKETPVIMLTARDELKDRVRGLDGGADDYLVKPFEMEELVARIRALSRRSEGARSPVLEVGPILVHTASRRVELNGESVELTAREYTLLELFVYKRDQVLSRDFLYERLFDENDESISNMLDVYIYKLRRKFGKQRIQTRRGQGYMLVSEPAAE